LRRSFFETGDGLDAASEENMVNVLFENDHLITVDKKSGWLTTPARDPQDTRPCLGRELQAQIGRQIYPVHRLDFEVSGIVLFAKTAEAHRIAQWWFEKCLIDKLYLAETVAGHSPAPMEWTLWTSKILRGKKRAYESPHGQISETRARVIEAGVKSWHWELNPITGRSHQLRWALANFGTPILGDVLYGGPQDRPGSIRLRAVSLGLTRVAPDGRLGLPEILRAPTEDLPV
jgi:tRNA pseudouridine32 synthase/23S rRNA pseudouridine746 synthase